MPVKYEQLNKCNVKDYPKILFLFWLCEYRTDCVLIFGTRLNNMFCFFTINPSFLYTTQNIKSITQCPATTGQHPPTAASCLCGSYESEHWTHLTVHNWTPNFGKKIPVLSPEECWKSSAHLPVLTGSSGTLVKYIQTNPQTSSKTYK